MVTKKRRQPYLRLYVKPHELDYRSINWYSEAHDLIVREYGDDADFFAKLLAATSPRKQVKANWRLADKIYKAYKTHQSNLNMFRSFDHGDINKSSVFRETKKSGNVLGDVLGGLMPAHAINVIRTLQGKDISGLKVNAFYQNLSGNYHVVTVDMWILLAYGFKKSLTELQYQRLSDKIKAEAYECGLLPAQYQALIWTAIRRESGKNYTSFVGAWQAEAQATLWD